VNLKRTIFTAMILSVVAVAVASAQDGRVGGSFITPFPQNDVYRVQVLGDWLADGLLNGMLEPTDSGAARINIQRKRWSLPGLMRRGTANDLAKIEAAFAGDRPHIAIVMLGAQDRFSLSSRRLRGGNEQWRKRYAERVDRLMKALKQGNRAVYWVGLPNMRRWRDNERARIMNDIIRERAYLNGVRFIDTYASFLDESGGYSPYGPDVTGRIRRLRDSDGVHFTYAGSRKLAHFVQRELKRDLARARREQAIPLAGSQADQARINPNRARLRAEGAENKVGRNVKKRRGVLAAAVGLGDQKVDHGKIELKLRNQTGLDEIVTVEIVRPAISAEVVALVTRKESPDRRSRMGDVLVDQISGGLTVMSSIIPPASSAAGRHRSPTQTPYFRVLEKGERLTPKRGRADDVSWPKPQETAEVKSEPVVKPEGRRRSRTR
jgi:hypothetical protein